MIECTKEQINCKYHHFFINKTTGACTCNDCGVEIIDLIVGLYKDRDDLQRKDDDLRGALETIRQAGTGREDDGTISVTMEAMIATKALSASGDNPKMSKERFNEITDWLASGCEGKCPEPKNRHTRIEEAAKTVVIKWKKEFPVVEINEAIKELAAALGRVSDGR